MHKPSVRVSRTVEFSDTDAAGLVHFSNYFRYMETAERVFFQQCGIPLMGTGPEGSHGFPRVETSCRFLRPLRFGDTVVIELTLEAVRSSRLRFSARFLRNEKGADSDAASEVVAEADMVTALVRLDAATGQLRSVAIPEDWHRHLAGDDRSTPSEAQP